MELWSVLGQCEGGQKSKRIFQECLRALLIKNTLYISVTCFQYCSFLSVLRVLKRGVEMGLLFYLLCHEIMTQEKHKKVLISIRSKFY